MAGDVESLQAEIVRQRKIIKALMDRAESSTSLQGSDFTLFQATVMLDEQVRARTAELEAALRDNERINRALQESEARYHALVDQSLVGIAIIEGDRFTYTNPRFAEIFGYRQDEILAMGPADIAFGADRQRVVEQLRRRSSGEVDRVHYQIVGRRKHGEAVDVEIHGNTTTIGGRRVLVSVLQDVTERTRAERAVHALQEQLRDQSLHDALTGLHNRRYLEETLARELLLAERRQEPVSLIMGDLDHFKAINDRYGHPAGDEVLRVFADLLRDSARGSDVNCRYGGEEFLLVLPGMTRSAAMVRAEQLRVTVEQTPVSYRGVSIATTVSFGVAAYPADGGSAEALIMAADVALYAAKRGGRNRVVAAG